MSRVIGYLTVDQKGRTTLPQRVREELGIVEGTQLRIERNDSGAFELVPSISIPQDQAWYHGADGRSRLERADEDLRTGRVTRARGETGTRRFLDSLKTSAASKRTTSKRAASKGAARR